MAPSEKLNSRIAEIGKMTDDEQAVEQLLQLTAQGEVAGAEEEEDDDELHLPNLTPHPDLEFDLQENVFVTNPTETWEFAKPVTVLRPYSLRGTVNAVRYAEERGLKVRAIGTRHSFSPVAATDDCYLDLSHTFRYARLTHNQDVPNLDQQALERLKEGLNRDDYFDVPGGMHIHQINHILCPDTDQHTARFGRKRMFNMGGGDVQTFAGAFSTGTHGTGGTYSAYHDMVRSVLVVAAEGRVYRVEPTDGLSDPERHRQHYASHPEEVQVELLQDDDKFYALLVSMGCFGIIYSAIIAITDMKLLHVEAVYHRSGWTPKFRERFRQPLLPPDQGQEYFVNILVNPYKLRRRLHPSVVVREIRPTTDPGSGKRETRPKRWPSFFANWPVSVRVIRHIANAGVLPKKRFIESALRSVNDHQGKGGGYTDLAYKIWNTGTGKLKSIGSAIEIAFPVSRVPAVIEVLLANLQQVGDQAKGYFVNSPIALRFVRPSQAYLAPNYHHYQGEAVEEWCYIEVLRVNSRNPEQDQKELELYKHLELMLVLQGGRPHWGLHFGLSFDQDLLRRLYPKFEAWLAAYRFFNPTGTFDNAFTRQAGLREERPA